MLWVCIRCVEEDSREAASIQPVHWHIEYHQRRRWHKHARRFQRQCYNTQQQHVTTKQLHRHAWAALHAQQPTDLHRSRLYNNHRSLLALTITPTLSNAPLRLCITCYGHPPTVWPSLHMHPTICDRHATTITWYDTALTNTASNPAEV